MTAPDDELLARIKNGADLDRRQFPPLTWVVPGLIPEGFGLMTGPPKLGKSWAVLGVCLALASGGDALGKIPVGDPRPVLLLALEDGDRRLQGRCRYLLGDGVPIPELLDYQTRMTPDEVTPTVRAWLRRHGSAAPLVVLDTLGKVLPDARPGEGAYQRDYRIGSELKTLVDAQPGACLLVVHHTRKAGSDDWMDSTSGTNGLNGSADFTINLSRARGEDTGIIRVTGRDVAESEHAVTTDNGRWTIDGNTLAEAAEKAAQAALRAGIGDRSAEILDYVAGQQEPVTPKQVAEALDIPEARRYLARLADTGRLVKAGYGKYAPTNSVPTVPLSQLAPSGQVAAVPELGQSELYVSHSDGALTSDWDSGTGGTPVSEGPSRPCGHPGDPSTKCGACIAEHLNRAAECRLCGKPTAPGSQWCAAQDSDHEHARQLVGDAA
jgi:hypothetical protein